MALQVGTLVGAPIRVNDSLDTYASAVDIEIQGTRHSVATIAARNAITTARRKAGMQCYVVADGNTYALLNDLVTWVLDNGSAGSLLNPGAGGTETDIQLISGNFGEWLALPALSADLVNMNFVPAYKTDLVQFPTRCITYIQGQFGIEGSFAGTTLLLGTLPANSIPAEQIKKYMIAQNIEMFLVIDTNGDVSLESKDGFNLPTTSGTPETQPIYIDIFYNPVVSTVAPTVYSATKTQTFLKNDCGSGFTGSLVSYTQTYESTVDQDTANALAANDPDFAANGQAYANANGTCTVEAGINNGSVTNESTTGTGNVEVVFTNSAGTNFDLNGGTPGTTNYQDITVGDVFSVRVFNGMTANIEVTVNGQSQNIASEASGEFTGIASPISVVYTN
jgi:hypothetical protein